MAEISATIDDAAGFCGLLLYESMHPNSSGAGKLVFILYIAKILGIMYEMGWLLSLLVRELFIPCPTFLLLPLGNSKCNCE